MGVERDLPTFEAVWRRYWVIAKDLVPGVRERRLEAERKAAEDHRLAEQARKDLDSAYGLLGGETGTDVSLDQIAEVLRTEKQVAQYSPKDSTVIPPAPYALFMREGLEAIQLTSTIGLRDMSLMMYHKAGDWEEVFSEQEKKGDPDSKLAETKRRAKACKAAEKLLVFMVDHFFDSID